VSPARSFRSLDIVLSEIRRGDLCAVLVEGEESGSDAHLLKFILREVTTEVAFFGRDGREGVRSDLQDMISQLPVDRLFAILDRDFESEQTIDQCFASDYRGHLFFWRRYTVENYLLEPMWVVEAVRQIMWGNPDLIPTEFRAESAVEMFLLNSAKQLAPLAAGNAAIANLTSEQRRRKLRVEARAYFEGDADKVLARLIAHYSGWSDLDPDLFSSETLTERYNTNLATIQSACQDLSGIHKFISGKTLLRMLHQRLLGIPNHKVRYADVLSRLMTLASKSVPSDMQALIQDHILPRLRKARNLAQE
jgi:hypothetical protein